MGALSGLPGVDTYAAQWEPGEETALTRERGVLAGSRSTSWKT